MVAWTLEATDSHIEGIEHVWPLLRIFLALWRTKANGKERVNIAYVFTQSFTNQLSVACTWSNWLLCRYGEEAIKKHRKSYVQYLE